MPILAAEFGVPALRSGAEQIYAGTNAGYTEKEQGDAAAMVFDNIIRAGFAGGIVYAWQDDNESGNNYSLLSLEVTNEKSITERLKDSYTIIKNKYGEY